MNKYKNRNLYVHNSEVTLMRTSVEENQKMGQWIARKLNQMEAPVRFFIPEKGVSALSIKGQPFYDTAADKALFDTLEKEDGFLQPNLTIGTLSKSLKTNNKYLLERKNFAKIIAK